MKFKRDVGDVIVYTLLQLPAREMDAEIKLKIQEFLAKPYKTSELYNLIIEISKCPTVKVRNYFVGGVSGLTRVTANLARDYDPPDDDEPRMINLEWCEEQLSINDKRFCKESTPVQS